MDGQSQSEVKRRPHGGTGDSNIKDTTAGWTYRSHSSFDQPTVPLYCPFCLLTSLSTPFINPTHSPVGETRAPTLYTLVGSFAPIVDRLFFRKGISVDIRWLSCTLAQRIVHVGHPIGCQFSNAEISWAVLKVT